MWVDTNDVYNNDDMYVQQYVNNTSYNKAIATKLHHTANREGLIFLIQGKTLSH